MSRIRIPWNNYSEDEISYIIESFYQYLGYQTYNYHLRDRSREQGVDLEVWKEGETEKQLISIKKKPRKKDINQLKELLSRKERIKRYIFVEKPSASFKREKEKAKEIQFWDSAKLTEEMLPQLPFFTGNIYLSNHKFERELHRFIELLRIRDFRVIKRIELAKIPVNSDMGQLPYILWRLKDDAVALQKSFRSLAEFFKNASFLDDVEFPNLEDLFLSYISSLDLLCEVQSSFRFFFAELLHLDANLVKSVMVHTHSSSHWISIWIYRPMFAHGTLIETCECWKREREAGDKIDREYFGIEWVYTSTMRALLQGKSEIFQNVWRGFETFIDDIFEFWVKRSIKSK